MESLKSPLFLVVEKEVDHIKSTSSSGGCDTILTVNMLIDTFGDIKEIDSLRIKQDEKI